MLEIRNISNQWGDTFSINDVSLEVEEGEYFVILGPTGAGKTLLLEIVAGLHYPKEGNVVFSGRDMTFEPPERRKVGFLYQDYSLFPNYSAKENIEYGLKVKKTKRPEMDRIVGELATMLKIEHLLGRDVATLSGGEQQRVAMARALAIAPDLLLLDEPFSALDEPTKLRLIEEMKALHRKERITTLHVTHSQEEAMILADRIAIMMDGKIVQVGSPKDIFFKPMSSEIAKFVRIENIWGVDVLSSSEKGTLVKLDGKEIMAPPNESVTGSKARLIIRPEDITLGMGEQTSARNRFRGTISSLEPRGFYNLVRIDCGFPVVAAVTSQSIEEMGLIEGKEVGVFFKTTALHVVSG